MKTNTSIGAEELVVQRPQRLVQLQHVFVVLHQEMVPIAKRQHKRKAVLWRVRSYIDLWIVIVVSGVTLVIVTYNRESVLTFIMQLCYCRNILVRNVQNFGTGSRLICTL